MDDRDITSDQLAALRWEIKAGDAAVLGRLDRLIDKVDAQTAIQMDHENRLRSVERWKLSIPISVLLAIATIIGAVIAKGGG